ncbi:MAG: DUF1566 domain-containing protein [Candidatus Scalindua sp.]|nr:DUF1566 domain-containing protein [Candidatus Scalindua sp.]
MKRALAVYFFASIIPALLSLGCDKANDRETTTDKSAKLIKLRSSYRELSVKQIQSTPHVSLREKKEWGFWGYSTIKNDYETKTVTDDKVVIDHATGLIWHQSGSSDTLKWSQTKGWLRDLNQRKYAGYDNWRLPTVEEAASLLESSKQNESLYIHAVFDKKQEWIWTGDSYDSRNSWSTDFSGGGVLTCNVEDGSYIRPVLSDN